MRCSILVLLLLLVAGAVPAFAGEPASVSFQECRRCAEPPVIDGVLDDPCWQALPAMEDFYRYWSPTPQPPPLKTTAKCCFDNTGFYLGITLFDEQVEKIRATISDRDNPVTWTDDCVEIMIDPGNTGTGYFKFCTNFLCARYEEKATNMVLDAGWNVEGWKVRTSRDAAAWYIEFFVPWTDLGAKPRPGDIWSFDLVRYGYSTGSFRGVTWSLGGSGAAPQNFGYLGFGRLDAESPAALQKLAQTVARTKGERFRLLLADQALIHDASGTWNRQPLRDWVQEPLDDAEATLREAEEVVSTVPLEDQKQPAEKAKRVRARLDALRAKTAPNERLSPSAASVVRQEALVLRRDIEEVKWESLLARLVATGS